MMNNREYSSFYDTANRLQHGFYKTYMLSNVDQFLEIVKIFATCVEHEDKKMLAEFPNHYLTFRYTRKYL